ncbi:30S ribosomal protein S8e [Sulfodiicoccus acidiphilus]|uniref:Small ribosomal subunit protein eS8 n=1 Tax=Sulfodiicoccus acidiphilus TaxID=1670455 RepID=A0A348B3Y5_9CREN|nr:30S ribosomal protein S8e [Sulfodiicoccus acidiphilus]BBD72887.1 30S ribosomal protein S8e [Sulfodiicoccus acidiphilus]GGT88232.1 30S ribosomal protein S8e [Sulfodiicoccus acidiphilus]
MGFFQGSDRRKITGGKKGVNRGKRRYEVGSPFTETKLGQSSVREVERTRGGNEKVRLRYVDSAVVTDPATKQSKKVKILQVLDVPANREYARRGIVVKGAKLRTEIGTAVVTSRPGQDGVVNAVLVRQ